jgi:hypothetical protein
MKYVLRRVLKKTIVVVMRILNTTGKGYGMGRIID